jgi:polysaccharide pyruvyl transferase WcaK-like protein
MGKFIVIGYYNQNNIGDEQYKRTFQYLFTSIVKESIKESDKESDNNKINYTYLNDRMSDDIVFINCDNLDDYIIKNAISDTDIIIVGGGDILNNYFLDTIIRVFNSKHNKIYAISVGIPYLDIIISNKLAIFDTIFLRTYQDIDLLKRIYTKINIQYIPDISCLSSKYITLSNTSNTSKTQSDISITHSITPCIQELDKQFEKTLISQKIDIKTDKKKITICLSRHFYNEKYINNYNNIIKQITFFIKYLISLNYYIILLPFDTCESNPNENDILIQNDVLNQLKKINQTGDANSDLINNIINIQYTLNENDIMDFFSQCEVIIPMRFHACLFSIYTNTPFLPIFSTRKITNLLKDISWNYAYKLPLNNDDIPTDINLNVLIFRFNNLINDYQECTQHLKQTNIIFQN